MNFDKQIQNCPPNLYINISTYDEKLYNEFEKKWSWAGQMYWSIQCLVSNQVSISNRLPPNIPPEKFMPLNTSPSQGWNFCLSDNCNENTDAFLLVFTFNPSSNNFNDYISFIFTKHGRTPDVPEHSLIDSLGRNVRIYLQHVTTSRRYPILELWITEGIYQPNQDAFPLPNPELPN